MSSSEPSGRRPRSGNRLFRPEAIVRHRMGEDAVRLPHYATLPVRVASWGLIAVVLASTGLALTISVPRYASGTAVVVGTADGPMVVAVFPPDELSRLRTGDVLDVTFDPSPEPVVTRIGSVQPAARCATGVECYPGLLDVTASAPGDPATVVVAPFPPSAGTASARGDGRATVETGRESLFSWVAP